MLTRDNTTVRTEDGEYKYQVVIENPTGTDQWESIVPYTCPKEAEAEGRKATSRLAGEEEE